MRCLFSILAAGLLSTPELLAQPSPKASAGDLTRWVGQLGSRSFREREAAAAALAAHRNPEVVELLRRAARSSDPEVARRAGELLVRVEQSIETERLLTARTLRLKFDNTPLADALAEFTRRTGIKVILAPAEAAKLATRKLTLDTGEVTPWQALDKLCKSAGLDEKIPEQAPALANPYDGTARMGGRRGRRRVVWMTPDRMPPPLPDHIELTASKNTTPSFETGGLRLKMLSPKGIVGTAREVQYRLFVNLDPRFGATRLVSIRVHSAIDDQGQRLVSPRMFIGEESHPFDGAENTVIIIDGEVPPRPSLKLGTIDLCLGKFPARLVKELRGTVALEVESLNSHLLTVNDLMKCRGKTIAGPGGASVKVLEAKREASGVYTLKVEVKTPPLQSMNFGGNGQVQMLFINRQAQEYRGLDRTILNEMQLREKGVLVVDALGKPLLMTQAQETTDPNATGSHVYTMTFSPKKGQGAPAKLLLSGRRNVLLQVPFVLRDVPLPK
jgi:hypothetical protein